MTVWRLNSLSWLGKDFDATKWSSPMRSNLWHNRCSVYEGQYFISFKVHFISGNWRLKQCSCEIYLFWWWLQQNNLRNSKFCWEKSSWFNFANHTIKLKAFTMHKIYVFVQSHWGVSVSLISLKVLSYYKF